MHVKRIWSQSTSITFDAEVMKAVIMKRKYQMLITAPIFSLILTSIFSWSLHYYQLCIVSYIPYSNPKGNQNFWYIDNLGKGWKENLPSFKTISKQIRASMFPIFLFFNHSWNLLSLSPSWVFLPLFQQMLLLKILMLLWVTLSSKLVPRGFLLSLWIYLTILRAAISIIKTALKVFLSTLILNLFKLST